MEGAMHTTRLKHFIVLQMRMGRRNRSPGVESGRWERTVKPLANTGLEVEAHFLKVNGLLSELFRWLYNNLVRSDGRHMVHVSPNAAEAKPVKIPVSQCLVLLACLLKVLGCSSQQLRKGKKLQ